MASMSRSARNRAAARARGTAPRGEVSRNLLPATRASLSSRESVAATGPGGRRGRVAYGGAGERGYSDAWADSPYYKNGITVDVRWSETRHTSEAGK